MKTLSLWKVTYMTHRATEADVSRTINVACEHLAAAVGIAEAKIIAKNFTIQRIDRVGPVHVANTED